MNNENKVVLDLESYIDMLNDIREYKRQAENISFNYDKMCNYLKEQVSSNNNYHIEGIITDKLSIKNTINMKLKNYHYESLFNELIKTGITFDLIEKIVDSMIIEHQQVKKEA